MLFSVALATVALGNVRLWKIFEVQTLVLLDALEALVFVAVFFLLLTTGQRFR
jgi:hypothetical protein